MNLSQSLAEGVFHDIPASFYMFIRPPVTAVRDRKFGNGESGKTLRTDLRSPAFTVFQSATVIVIFSQLEGILFLYSSYTGEHFPLDCLKQSTAAGRHIGNLIGKTEFVDAGY